MYHKVSPVDKLMEAFKGSQLSSRTFGRDKNTITLSFPLHYIVFGSANNIIIHSTMLHHIKMHHITSHYISFGTDENTIIPSVPQSWILSLSTLDQMTNSYITDAVNPLIEEDVTQSNWSEKILLRIIELSLQS